MWQCKIELLYQLLRLLVPGLKKTPWKFETICVRNIILHLSFSQKVSWNALMSCRLHHGSCVTEYLEWWYLWRRIFSPPCPITVWHLSYCSLSHRVNADLEIFLGVFQLCISLLATKTTSLGKTNCLEVIPSLLSELILLFLPKDLWSPRRESNANQVGFS